LLYGVTSDALDEFFPIALIVNTFEARQRSHVPPYAPNSPTKSGGEEKHIDCESGGEEKHIDCELALFLVETRKGAP
jgi:hypothetical protein